MTLSPQDLSQAPRDDRDDLKPCPFCGNAPRTLRYNGAMQVTCSSAVFECAGFDVIAPVDMWNRRIPAHPTLSTNTPEQETV